MHQERLPTEFAPLSHAHWQTIAAAHRLPPDPHRHPVRTPRGRNLPKTYPAWQSVYHRAAFRCYRQWRDRGLLAKLLQALVALCRVPLGRRAQPPQAIDSQSVHEVCFVALATASEGHKKVNAGQEGLELLLQLEACRPRLALICVDQAYQGDFQEAADWCGYRVGIAQKPESAQGFVAPRGRWQPGRRSGRTQFSRKNEPTSVPLWQDDLAWAT